jgi:hypothetical protein
MTQEQYVEALHRAHQHRNFHEGLEVAGLCLADRAVASRFDFKLVMAPWPGTDEWACIVPKVIDVGRR